MERFFRISLLIAGVVNSLPFLIVFIPYKVSDSYGVELVNSNYELLLRHRAVLFGIIGGLLIYSGITKKFYGLSTVAGLISMMSFVLLYFLIVDINQELKKVMIIDVIATILLCMGAVLHWTSVRNTR